MATTEAAGRSEVRAAYWWTHTSLSEEAAPPDATAAEAASRALAAITKTVRDLIAQNLSVLRTTTTVEQRARAYSSLQLSDKLPPLMTQVRRAMEKAWWEGRREEDESAHGGRGGLRPTAERAADGLVVEAHARRQLEEIQYQVFLQCLQSFVKGVTAAVREAARADVEANNPSLSGPAKEEGAPNGVLAVCIDGLLTDMCFGLSGGKERTGEEGLRSAWQGGLMQSLRRMAGAHSESAHEGQGEEGRAAATMTGVFVGYASRYLNEELGLSTVDRAAYSSLLDDAASRRLVDKLRGLTTTAKAICEGLSVQTADEGAVAARIQALAAFLRYNVAAVLLSMGDGLLSRGLCEYTADCSALLGLSDDGHTAATTMTTTMAVPLETPASLSPLFHAASLATATTLARGQSYFEAVSDLLTNCRRCLASLQQIVSGSEKVSGEVLSAVEAVQTTCEEHLGRQAHSLMAVFAQYASTQPLLLPSLQLILSHLYSAGGTPNYRVYVADADVYSRTRSATVLPSSRSGAEGARRYNAAGKGVVGEAAVAMPWQSFADVCLARACTLVASLMENPPDALFAFLAQPLETASVSAEVSEFASPVGLSLLCHPVVTLVRLLTMALNPTLVSRTCSADQAVAESGGGSERRGRAFREDEAATAPTGDEAATVFFPRLYAVFGVLEAGLRSLALHHRSDASREALLPVRAMLVGFFAASLRRAQQCIARDSGAAEVAAGELHMFVSFLLSSTPVYPTRHLSMVRQALCMEMKSNEAEAEASATFRVDSGAETVVGETESGEMEALLLLCLQRQVVRSRFLGMAVFLLPLLRALGVDHGVAQDLEDLSAGVRYPASAAVAYLRELPRSFFCRGPVCLALRQKEDAIAYLDRLVFSKLANAESGSGGGGEPRSVEAFLDVVSEAGKVVLTRLHQQRYDASAAGSLNVSPVVVDVLTNVFFGVLRLCAEVTHWDRTVRRELQRRILLRTTEKLKAGRTDEEEPIKGLLMLPRAFLLRGGDAAEAGSDEGEDEATRSARAEEPLSAFERWLWEAELDAVDESPYYAVKGLVRLCNTSYTKQISTQALLRARTLIDQQAEARRGERRAAALAALDAAVSQDLAKIRRVIAAQEEEKLSAGEAKASEALADAGKEQPLEGKTAATALSKDPSVAAHAPPPPPPPVLSLSQIRSYMEYVFNALLLRGRLSVVDGALCGIALERFLYCCARCDVDRGALVSLLRVFLVRARGLMAAAQQPQLQRSMPATRQEATSLSVLFHAAAERLALAYKMSFGAPASLPSAATAVSRQLLTKEAVERAARIFPHREENEAVNALTVALDGVTGLVKHYLGRLTPLGDWSAYAVTLHCRHLIRLVSPYEDAFNRAVAARRESLQRLGTSSPGFQALVSVERPLGEGMAGPVSSVSRLFQSVRASDRRGSHTVSRREDSGLHHSSRRPGRAEKEEEHRRGGNRDDANRKRKRSRDKDSPERGRHRDRDRGGRGHERDGQGRDPERGRGRDRHGGDGDSDGDRGRGGGDGDGSRHRRGGQRSRRGGGHRR